LFGRSSLVVRRWPKRYELILYDRSRRFLLAVDAIGRIHPLWEEEVKIPAP
jgi:hypothetical protein